MDTIRIRIRKISLRGLFPKQEAKPVELRETTRQSQPFCFDLWPIWGCLKIGGAPKLNSKYKKKGLGPPILRHDIPI